jgi:alcohol dehydrogenase
MRRYSSHLTVIVGFAAAVILLAAGGLLTWGSAYVHNTVQGQLSSQQIFFPPKAAFANPKAGTEITPSMIPSVSQYAGQQMLTGQQAEAYADHFIAVHLSEIGGGKTYSQLSTEAIAQPKNVALAGEVATVFKGTTLRSMLLNAYGCGGSHAEPSFTTVPASKAWEEVPTRRSPTMVTLSYGWTRPRSAVPTCTSWRATCPRCARAGSWATRPSAPSTRSATASVPAHAGDRVLVSCISACGTCRFCREGRYGQCLSGGGWVLGHTIDGTQAEYVRVPYADTSTFRIPDGVTDEESLMLADILPTGYEVGVLAGGVRPGDVVAVVGAGPVGLSAIACARLFSPSHIVAIDLSDARLEAAKHFGADVTVNNSREDPLAVIRDLTGRLGADVSIEAVGTPGHLRAGRQAGPAGRPDREHRRARQAAVLHLEEQWIRDITITTGLVDTSSTPTLMRLVTTGQIDAKRFVTHHFGLDQFEEAYDVFANAATPARSRSSSARRPTCWPGRC